MLFRYRNYNAAYLARAEMARPDRWEIWVCRNPANRATDWFLSVVPPFCGVVL